MDRRILRLTVSIAALVAAASLSGMEQEAGGRDSCYLCADELAEYCQEHPDSLGWSEEECFEDNQCVHIACNQLCGFGDSIRCEENDPECWSGGSFVARYECTDELNRRGGGE